MPRPKSYTTIAIRRDTRDIVRRVSWIIGKTYDETIRIALEIIKNISNCRAVYVVGNRFRTDVDIINTDRVKLICKDYGISIDPNDYRKLRGVIRILPKPSEKVDELDWLEIQRDLHRQDKNSIDIASEDISTL